MPYIEQTRRPRFDTIVDGLIKRARDYDRDTLRTIAANLVVYAFTRRPLPIDVDEITDGITKDLAQRIDVRGDANYCLCRLLLETLKPESGWSYHSLSDVVATAYESLVLVHELDPGNALEIEGGTYAAMSVLNDVASEIRRRLLDPYEDRAILKNGDMACFANEDFAYVPVVFDFETTRGGPCGCVCDPCVCEEQVVNLDMDHFVSGDLVSGEPMTAFPGSCPIEISTEEQAWREGFSAGVHNNDFPDCGCTPLSGCQGICRDRELPPITEALTQEQIDEAERAARKQG